MIVYILYIGSSNTKSRSWGLQKKILDPIQYFLKHMKYFKQRYTSQLQCRIFYKHDQHGYKILQMAFKEIAY